MENEQAVPDTTEQAAAEVKAEQLPAENAPQAPPDADEKPAVQPESLKDQAEDEAKAPDEPAAAPQQAQEAAPPEHDARLADAELRAAAALAGIPAARIPYAVRMADAAKVEDAESAARQIAAIVRDVPELKQQAQSTGSNGNFARKGAAQDPVTQAILDGFDRRF